MITVYESNVTQICLLGIHILKGVPLLLPSGILFFFFFFGLKEYNYLQALISLFRWRVRVGRGVTPSLCLVFHLMNKHPLVYEMKTRQFR